MKDDKIFSDKFHNAADKLNSRKESYLNAKNQQEKDRIEFIALLETNMNHFKLALSGKSNFNKRQKLFDYINDNFYHVPTFLTTDDQINVYLRKNGFFSPLLYTIIDILIVTSISSLLLFIAINFGLEFSFNVAIVWSLITLAFTLLFDTTTNMNFYMVKK